MEAAAIMTGYEFLTEVQNTAVPWERQTAVTVEVVYQERTALLSPLEVQSSCSSGRTILCLTTGSTLCTTRRRPNVEVLSLGSPEEASCRLATRDNILTTPTAHGRSGSTMGRESSSSLQFSKSRLTRTAATTALRLWRAACPT